MLNNIFDSHCHYDDSWFGDESEKIIGDSLSSTVCGMIHASVNNKSSEFGIKMSKKFNHFYTSVGVHPENLCDLTDNYLEDLRKYVKENEKVVAIGEIGLDYHYKGYDRKKQIETFVNQIILANELDLPVIVHLRDANEDGMEILKKYKPKGVMHCFSGSLETAKEVLALGMYISFTGVLTFKNSKKAHKALSVIPIERLLLETDCPYMAPEPFRGKRCQSTMISELAKEISKEKNLSPQEVINITTNNTKTLFNIK